MNSEPAITVFHAEIISIATEKLGRALTEPEQRFVISRGGFIALEFILDTVRSEPAPEVERYLNSEVTPHPPA